MVLRRQFSCAKIEAGESPEPEEASWRELKEELGITNSAVLGDRWY